MLLASRTKQPQKPLVARILQVTKHKLAANAQRDRRRGQFREIGRCLDVGSHAQTITCLPQQSCIVACRLSDDMHLHAVHEACSHRQSPQVSIMRRDADMRSDISTMAPKGKDPNCPVCKCVFPCSEHTFSTSSLILNARLHAMHCNLDRRSARANSCGWAVWAPAMHTPLRRCNAHQQRLLPDCASAAQIIS